MVSLTNTKLSFNSFFFYSLFNTHGENSSKINLSLDSLLLYYLLVKL